MKRSLSRVRQRLGHDNCVVGRSSAAPDSKLPTRRSLRSVCPDGPALERPPGADEGGERDGRIKVGTGFELQQFRV